MGVPRQGQVSPEAKAFIEDAIERSMQKHKCTKEHLDVRVKFKGGRLELVKIKKKGLDNGMLP